MIQRYPGLVHGNLPKCTVWYTKSRSCELSHRNLSGCKVKHNWLNNNNFVVVFAGPLQGLYVVFGTIFVADDFCTVCVPKTDHLEARERVFRCFVMRRNTK